MLLDQLTGSSGTVSTGGARARPRRAAHRRHGAPPPELLWPLPGPQPHRPDRATAVEESGFGEAYRRWRSLVAEHLAVIPDDLRTARIDRAVTSTILTIARWEGRPTQAPGGKRASPTSSTAWSPPSTRPVSPRTRELLATGDQRRPTSPSRNAAL